MFRKIAQFQAAALAVVLTSPLFGQSVTLKPGTDVAARVASSAPGTHFIFSPGIYIAQQINPRDGDSFSAGGNVILNGAKPISFLPAGKVWLAQVDSIPMGKNRCVVSRPLCNIQRDLYSDDKVLVPVSTLAELTSTTWFYDQANHQAVIGFNPSGHKLELAAARWAFSNTGRNVSISHLIVEKYASPPQFGAIGAQGWFAQGGAQGWTVTDTEVRLSHGTGIQLADRSTIERCNVHDNGQKGVGARGADILVENNEIAYNNYAGYDYGWEAGGSKFSRTTNLRVLNNYVHDNLGSGLWTDIDNKNTTYRLNRVDHNAGEGIQHEISYDALIEKNTVRWNGSPPRVSLWSAQIALQNSSNVIVRDNIVVVSAGAGNGITVINQERGAGDYGPRLAVGNQVIHNTVTYEGSGGASGLMDTLGNATNNLFENNDYILKAGGQHFESRGRKTWQQFRALGNEKQGRQQDSDGKLIEP